MEGSVVIKGGCCESSGCCQVVENVEKVDKPTNGCCMGENGKVSECCKVAVTVSECCKVEENGSNTGGCCKEGTGDNFVCCKEGGNGSNTGCCMDAKKEVEEEKGCCCGENDCEA